jgi:tetratricopeptide (TPR) repeat protein
MEWGGVSLLVLSPFFGWLKSGFGWKINGYSIPVFSSLPTDGFRFHILSFGSIVILIGLIGLTILCFHRFHRMRLFIGGFALFLSFLFFYQTSLKKPIWLETFSDQNQQLIEIGKFTNDYLAPYREATGSTVWTHLRIVLIPDQMIALLSFLSTGWYFLTIGGVLLTAGSFVCRFPRRREILIAFLIVFIICSSVLFAPFIVGEYLLIRGDRYRIQGLYTQALSDYLKAGQYNPGLEYHTSYRLNIGEVYESLERVEKADYHLFQGSVLESEQKDQEAVFQYYQAMEKGSIAQAYVAKNRLGWLYIYSGLNNYKTGNRGEAITVWKKAIEVDPAQLQTHYYLAKAYFEMGLYEEAIQENKKFLKRSYNTIFNADVYANLGDCYSKLQDHQKAREFYYRSLALDDDQNYRAWMGLVGS